MIINGIPDFTDSNPSKTRKFLIYISAKMPTEKSFIYKARQENKDLFCVGEYFAPRAKTYNLISSYDHPFFKGGEIQNFYRFTVGDEPKDIEKNIKADHILTFLTN